MTPVSPLPRMTPSACRPLSAGSSTPSALCSSALMQSATVLGVGVGAALGAAVVQPARPIRAALRMALHAARRIAMGQYSSRHASRGPGVSGW